jgi:hypothetical protein
MENCYDSGRIACFEELCLCSRKNIHFRSNCDTGSSKQNRSLYAMQTFLYGGLIAFLSMDKLCLAPCSPF